MTRWLRSDAPRRALGAALAALALCAPTAAYPISLARLLQLPLEQLLRLEITSMRSTATELGGERHGR
ncbi:MAG: hypothetical protein OEW27_10725 [Aquincola sp.]|nr:hypothetical protein [Aquincola sp.]MDH5330412.1 hypothetical protein [Aquincola sp.]